MESRWWDKNRNNFITRNAALLHVVSSFFCKQVHFLSAKYNNACKCHDLHYREQPISSDAHLMNSLFKMNRTFIDFLLKPRSAVFIPIEFWLRFQLTWGDGNDFQATTQHFPTRCQQDHLRMNQELIPNLNPERFEAIFLKYCRCSCPCHLKQLDSPCRNWTFNKDPFKWILKQTNLDLLKIHGIQVMDWIDSFK